MADELEALEAELARRTELQSLEAELARRDPSHGGRFQPYTPSETDIGSQIADFATSQAGADLAGQGIGAAAGIAGGGALGGPAGAIAGGAAGSVLGKKAARFVTGADQPDWSESSVDAVLGAAGPATGTLARGGKELVQKGTQKYLGITNEKLLEAKTAREGFSTVRERRDAKREAGKILKSAAKAVGAGVSMPFDLGLFGAVVGAALGEMRPTIAKRLIKNKRVQELLVSKHGAPKTRRQIKGSLGALLAEGTLTGREQADVRALLSEVEDSPASRRELPARGDGGRFTNGAGTISRPSPESLHGKSIEEIERGDSEDDDAESDE